MKHLISMGEHGAEALGELSRPDACVTVPVDPLLALIKDNLPSSSVVVERDDGVRTSVETKVLPLGSPEVFKLIHALAPYEPTVFVARNVRVAWQGMLSGNYDTHGEQRLPSVKIIPLQQPLPHTATGIPDAGGVAMLGGAVSAERKGVGSEAGNVAQDFEHRATIIGAVSVNNYSLAVTHANHAVRARSSVATGLSNGTLGNLFAPGSIEGFAGFGRPLCIDKGSATDISIMIPTAYLDEPDKAFGSMLSVDSARVMLGAGMRGLTERYAGGVSEIKRQILTVSQGVSAKW